MNPDDILRRVQEDSVENWEPKEALKGIQDCLRILQVCTSDISERHQAMRIEVAKLMAERQESSIGYSAELIYRSKEILSLINGIVSTMSSIVKLNDVVTAKLQSKHEARKASDDWTLYLNNNQIETVLSWIQAAKNA